MVETPTGLSRMPDELLTRDLADWLAQVEGNPPDYMTEAPNVWRRFAAIGLHRAALNQWLRRNRLLDGYGRPKSGVLAAMSAERRRRLA